MLRLAIAVPPAVALVSILLCVLRPPLETYDEPYYVEDAWAEGFFPYRATTTAKGTPRPSLSTRDSQGKYMLLGPRFQVFAQTLREKRTPEVEYGTPQTVDGTQKNILSSQV